MQEPRRRGLLPDARNTVLPLREVYAYFRAHDRTYLPMFAAMGTLAAATAPVSMLNAIKRSPNTET